LPLRACLLYGLHGLENIRVARPYAIVNLDKFPAHDSLCVDDVGGRMRPPPPLRIEQSVAVDDFVILIFQQRKLDFYAILGQFLSEPVGICVTVDADRQQLSGRQRRILQ
jgi:hypothetical protein